MEREEDVLCVWLASQVNQVSSFSSGQLRKCVYSNNKTASSDVLRVTFLSCSVSWQENHFCRKDQLFTSPASVPNKYLIPHYANKELIFLLILLVFLQIGSDIFCKSMPR